VRILSSSRADESPLNLRIIQSVAVPLPLRHSLRDTRRRARCGYLLVSQRLRRSLVNDSPSLTDSSECSDGGGGLDRTSSSDAVAAAAGFVVVSPRREEAEEEAAPAPAATAAGSMPGTSSGGGSSLLHRTGSASAGMAAMSNHLTAYVSKKLHAVSVAANTAAASASGGASSASVDGGGGGRASRASKEAAAMVADLTALEDRGKELKLKKMQLRQLMMLLGEREATPSPRPRESLTLDHPTP
jgi:hypothetical protein